jgi:uncharacterized protein (DUF58 family)
MTHPPHDGPGELDLGRVASLRLRARSIAEGVYAGSHRSARRGTGVEFGGHRNYVPGDDLRRLDRHALMRHTKLLVREFEAETERVLRLVVDATASMGYRGPGARQSKLGFATTLAAALTWLSVLDGDPVALDWIGGEHARWLGPMRGREALERMIGALGSQSAAGNLVEEPELFERALAPVRRYARRGALTVVLSDLLDLPEGALQSLGGLAGTHRSLLVLCIRDPAEASFPFSGPARLVALEGDTVVETEAGRVRREYLAALAEQTAMLQDFFVHRGATILFAESLADPVELLSHAVAALGTRRW